MDEPLRLPPSQPVGDLVWVAGGEVDETSVSLRFFGYDLEPDALTTKLGGSPTKSCRKGDVHRGKRYDRVEKTGSWRLHTERSEDQSLDAQINAILDRLTDDVAVWRDLTTRFQADLFCGLWLKHWNRGVDLKPRTLQRIAERGLRLGLDIYFDTDTEEG